MLGSPPIASLWEAFDVDFMAGTLHWKPRPDHHFKNNASAHAFNLRWAGKPAMATDNGKGYLCGTFTLNGEAHRLQRHRVIYAMSVGSWPEHHVDHKDGNSLNNCGWNLREATNQENMRNCKRSKANTSGHTGVYWFKPRSRWMAMITIDGRSKSLGYFRYKKDAIKARKKAEGRYGFSERHGEERSKPFTKFRARSLEWPDP